MGMKGAGSPVSAARAASAITAPQYGLTVSPLGPIPVAIHSRSHSRRRTEQRKAVEADRSKTDPRGQPGGVLQCGNQPEALRKCLCQSTGGHSGIEPAAGLPGRADHHPIAGKGQQVVTGDGVQRGQRRGTG